MDLLFCWLHACHYASVPEANAETVCIASAVSTLKHCHVVLPVQQQSPAVQASLRGANSLCKSLAVSKGPFPPQQWWSSAVMLLLAGFTAALSGHASLIW